MPRFQTAARYIAQLPRQTYALMASAAGLLVLLWPRKTAPAYINSLTRDSWFGPLQYRHDPQPGNPENIVITNDFYAKNIIREFFPIIGYAAVHADAAPSLRAALQEIERKGWAKKIKTFAGAYNPRFVRGSTTNLSSHSYGTSIDINDRENPLGGQPTADQKLLAGVFEKHGWYWGNRFSRSDPMHFEYVLKPKGIV